MPLRMPEPTGFDTPRKSPTTSHFLTYQSRPQGQKKQAPALAGGSTKSSPHLWWWTKRAENTLLGATAGCLPELAIAKDRVDASDPGHFLPQTAVAGGAPLPVPVPAGQPDTARRPRRPGGVLKSTPLAFCQGYTWCSAGGFTYNGIVRDGIHADFAVDDSGEPILPSSPTAERPVTRSVGHGGTRVVPAWWVFRLGGGVCRC
jgi:hypothetical protein